jgi:predicted DNA-binding transcriptional regulator YafY
MTDKKDRTCHFKNAQGIEIMEKVSKHQRHGIINGILRGKDQDTGLTVSQLHEALINEGIKVELRTVRRDLDDLTKTHGLVATESRPERYYPSKDFELKFDLELNEQTLQVLLVALNNLKFTSHSYFKNIVTEAENAIYANLDSNIEQELRASKEKYHFDYSTGGKPSDSNLKDFEKIMRAIRENKIITCKNNSPAKSDEYNKRWRTFAPCLFLLSSGIPYVIAQDLEDKNFKTLRMTRLQDVRITKSNFDFENIKDQLNLDNLIGGYGATSEEAKKISFYSDETVARYFQERVIHPSQQVVEVSEGKFSVSMQCALSSEIARLISSFGGRTSEIMPVELREDVFAIWRDGYKNIA